MTANEAVTLPPPEAAAFRHLSIDRHTRMGSTYLNSTTTHVPRKRRINAATSTGELEFSAEPAHAYRRTKCTETTNEGGSSGGIASYNTRPSQRARKPITP